jgi:hypothetical protein|tara:strand:- start:78 stop:455 length:378 start_codon:yes stop_codon:yes gene_type:complete
MSNEDLLNIPDFLRRKPEKVRDVEPEEIEWWMPDLSLYHKDVKEKQARREEIKKLNDLKYKRNMKKQLVQYDVLDAVSKQHITFHKIRKFISDDVADNEIKSAIRSLIKQNKLIKPSQKTYKVKL